ncbi:MAG TPA: ABC transporter substrate-binding protein [Candidatus Binatia bacterium]|jgi:ABC-type nitrate/sulfonate/bicarbonate transport system substrate-binding protein|nr:ABC transporter substrate-binding protein [Candidatus Binatia bacterium]
MFPGALKRRFKSLLIIIVLLIDQAAFAQEMSLRAVYNALSGVMAPIWVAQDAGLFVKHGVTVDLKYLAATTAVQGMLGGGEEIGLVGNQGIDAKLEGADLIYVASGLPVFVFQIYARPEIKSMSDLKGKVVAVTQPAASTDYAMRIVLKKNGLEPDKDVRILYAQDINGVLTSVSAGNAAAGIMSAPTSIRAKAAGLKMLVDVTALKIPFLFTGILSSPRVVRDKSEAASRFLRGYIESLAVIRRDKETTTRAMAKFLKTSDAAVLDSVYEEYKDVFPVTPLVSVAEVKAVLDVAKSPKAKQMKPEEFFDNSLVQKIQASGFIEQVNKR